MLILICRIMLWYGWTTLNLANTKHCSNQKVTPLMKMWKISKALKEKIWNQLALREEVIFNARQLVYILILHCVQSVSHVP